jgi:putative ABC transport system substrate-binding protein
MRRREFITLLGGAAAAWPLAARAQQAALPVVGFIGAGSRAVLRDELEAFEAGLKDLGFFQARMLFLNTGLPRANSIDFRSAYY